jgi:hypothetical protein
MMASSLLGRDLMSFIKDFAKLFSNFGGVLKKPAIQKLFNLEQ